MHVANGLIKYTRGGLIRGNIGKARKGNIGPQGAPRPVSGAHPHPVKHRARGPRVPPPRESRGVKPETATDHAGAIKTETDGHKPGKRTQDPQREAHQIGPRYK